MKKEENISDDDVIMSIALIKNNRIVMPSDELITELSRYRTEH